MRISIVIPVYNNWNFTKSCLKDISKLNERNEIIVVDNGSSDLTKTLTNDNVNQVTGAEFNGNFKLIRNAENLGFAKACNSGYSEASGDVVIFLNNDIRVKDRFSDWTDILANRAMDGYLVGPTGGLLDNKFNFICETTAIYPKNFYLSGWCLAAKKEVFKKLDVSNDEIFSTEFGIAFFEDTDLSFRAAKLNIPMKIEAVPVVHFGHVTAKQLNLSGLYKSAHGIFSAKWAKGKR